MDRHNQIHNDIKPQNYLVKFLNGNIDLTSIEIVLTDFGLAGSETKGGTPIFASPECLADPNRKDKSTDIFSLGRVFLCMILPKEKFLEFLFVPITKSQKENIAELIENEPILNLISNMIQIEKRPDLSVIRENLKTIVQIHNSSAIVQISDVIQMSMSIYTTQYIDALKHFS